MTKLYYGNEGHEYISCPYLLSVDDIQELVYDAKDTLASLLNVDKSVTDLTIEFAQCRFMISCKTKRDVVIFVAKTLAQNYPDIEAIIYNRYYKMKQTVWNLLDKKFNFGPYIFEQKDFQIRHSIFITQDNLINRLVHRVATNTMSDFYVHKIQKYYYDKFNISDIVISFVNDRCPDEVSIVNIQNGKIVLTKVHDTLYPSIQQFACIRNLLHLASPEQICNAISEKYPNYTQQGINVSYIGMVLHNIDYINDNINPIDILVKAKIINEYRFKLYKDRESERIRKENEERQLRENRFAIVDLVKDLNVMYGKDDTLYILNQSGLITCQKYNIIIDDWIITGPIEKCMQYLIDTNFLGKLKCDPKIVNTVFLKNAIDRVISNIYPSKIKLDEIVDELKIYNVFRPTLSGNSLNDYFSITYIDKSIDIIPAYDSKTDTFYKINKAFDYVTVDLSAGTMNRIPVTREEGVEVIKRFQSEIANYALDVIVNSRKMNKYNIPRNMFRLDDMVYIKSQEFIRVWFGIKGMK